jgi:uncharacterized protein (DUF2147 family)
MTRFTIAAALLLASTSAFAGDVYDFKIGGQSIHIEQPRNCNSPSCATISIPGIYESGPKRKRTRDGDDMQAAIDRDKKDADTKPAPTDNAPVNTAPAATAPAPAASSTVTSPASPSEKSLEPANGIATSAASKANIEPDTAASRPSAQPAGGLAPPPVTVAPPAPSAAEIKSASVGVSPTSPVGVWLTEEKEGKVRIEDCGGNLCGYSVDAKTNANGEKVLINMKPGKDKWTGRIHDPNSGSSYDSTIAMKGSDRLRVQGCAFGGMFCGGQTWTRAN